MDLNEKIAQRRKEREQEAAVVQAEIDAKELAIKAANTKNEFDKQVAQSRLAYEGKVPAIDTDTKKYIEKEQMIEKMALSRWTSTENFIGFLLFVFVILAFFKSWILGVLMLIVGLFYFDGKNNKYKNQIEIEIKQIKDFQGNL